MNKPIQKEIGSAWLDEQKSEVRGSTSVSAEVAAKTGGLRMNPTLPGLLPECPDRV